MFCYSVMKIHEWIVVSMYKCISKFLRLKTCWFNIHNGIKKARAGLKWAVYVSCGDFTGEFWVFLWEWQTQWVEKTVGEHCADRSQVLGLLRLTQFNIVLTAIALLNLREFSVSDTQPGICCLSLRYMKRKYSIMIGIILKEHWKYNSWKSYYKNAVN